MQMQREAWGPGLTSGLRQPPCPSKSWWGWHLATGKLPCFKKCHFRTLYLLKELLLSSVECFTVARSAGLLFYYRHPAPSWKRGGGRTECRAVGCDLLEQTPPWPSLTACTVGRFLLKHSCFYYFQFCSQILSNCCVPDLAQTTGPSGGTQHGHIQEDFHFHSGSPAPGPLCPKLKRATTACWE